MATEITTSSSHAQKTIPLSIKLGAQQKDWLAQFAKEKERSVHFLLCQAVKEFIDREQARSDFFETAQKASEHYKQTGLHTTHEDMKAWVDSLGTTNEQTPPLCHT